MLLRHIQEKIDRIAQKRLAQIEAEVNVVCFVNNWRGDNRCSNSNTVAEVLIYVTPPRSGRIPPGYSSIRAYLLDSAQKAVAQERTIQAAHVPVRAIIDNGGPQSDKNIDYRHSLSWPVIMSSKPDGLIVFADEMPQE